MSKIKKILACIDLSEYSFMTLEYALEIAQATQAEIVVFNVINQRDISGVEMVSQYYPSKLNVYNYIKDVRKNRDERLRLFIKNNFFDEKSRMKIIIETGIPSECILKAVETEKADLVVMANKGRGNISRVLFGSAAEKVFRHCPVPVVSIRDKGKFKRRNTDA